MYKNMYTYIYVLVCMCVQCIHELVFQINIYNIECFADFDRYIIVVIIIQNCIKISLSYKSKGSQIYKKA